MIKIAEHLLSKLEIKFEYVQEESHIHVLYFDQKTDQGIMRGLIGINYDQEMVLINRIYPTPLPKNSMHHIMEYISRINRANNFGTYELDHEDMLFGCSFSFYYSELEQDNEKHLERYFNVLTDGLNKYYPGALKIGYGEKDPAIVIDQIELNVDPRLN